MYSPSQSKLTEKLNITNGMKDVEYFKTKMSLVQPKPMAKHAAKRSDDFGAIPNLRSPGRTHKQSARLRAEAS